MQFLYSRQDYEQGGELRASIAGFHINGQRCKMLEHVISSSIMDHLEKHDIMTYSQHGFRKKRSCETQFILTIQDLQNHR